MSVPPFRLVQNGELSLSELKRLARMVELLTDPKSANSLVAINFDPTGGLALGPNKYESFRAKITGAPTGSAYPWAEVYFDGSTWQTAGRTGTASSTPAYEASGGTGVAADTIVELQFDPGGERFIFADPTGISAGGGLTVTDDTTTVNGVATLSVDPNDAFTIVDDGSGEATIHIAVASASLSGIVSTTSQTFAGEKTFNAEIQVNGNMRFSKSSSIDYLYGEHNHDVSHIYATGGGWRIRGGLSTSTLAQSDYIDIFDGTGRIVVHCGHAGDIVLSGNGSYPALKLDDGTTELTGATGTSGGGDTVTAGIITALGGGGSSVSSLNTLTGALSIATTDDGQVQLSVSAVSSTVTIDAELEPIKAARLYRSTAQSISNVTATKILLQAEDYDQGGIGDHTTNYRIDIDRDGKYLVCAEWVAVFNASNVQVYIYVNGSEVARDVDLETAVKPASYAKAMAVLDLSNGDYVEMYVFHDNGSAQNTSTTLGLRPTLSVTEMR